MTSAIVTVGCWFSNSLVTPANEALNVVLILVAAPAAGFLSTSSKMSERELNPESLSLTVGGTDEPMSFRHGQVREFIS
jgi:hypothetical protein